jgi:predicted Zn-dependent protease
MPEDIRLSYDPGSMGQRIDLAAAGPRILTIAFTLLWFAGWLLLLLLTALDYVRFGRLNLVAVVLLVAGGPPVGLALVWAALGKRESLIVTPSELRIYRWVGPIRLGRSIGTATVIGVRAAVAPRGVTSDFIAVREFYRGGCGSVAIDTASRTVTVGHTLSPEASGQLIEDIRRFVPQLGTGSSQAAIPRRRPIDYAAGFMTVMMIGFAVNLPVRLAITDRPICFYDDSVVPRHPIDVSGMRPTGRVSLVPIDDFPVDRAQAIAEDFRTRFGVAIDVEPAIKWPEGAYAERRRQMNSATMLTHLESTYATAGERVVVIGLTTRDMFNSDVGWGYVFSYRRANRVGVVSPARMDRGCMGVFQADDDRIMARLRKMVGKNIGIMYFGLDMSADPASMLYARIGGPQELDAMSEQF